MPYLFDNNSKDWKRNYFLLQKSSGTSTKCFEHVNARMLADAANTLGYPLDILAVSLTSYRWRRVIFFQDNISAEQVWPGSGIVAGSPHATFELTLYTITTLGSEVA